MDMIPYRMIALVLVVALLLTAVTPARAEALEVGTILLLVGGIGGAHEIAPLLDGVVGLEHHRDARALRHERAEAREEGPLAVDGVETRRVVERHLYELGGEHLEARLLDLREDRAGGPLGDGVGLDDGQRALHHAPITSRRSVTWPT